MAPPVGGNNRANDPNVLYERYRKRDPKESLGTENPLSADDWLEHTENIFEIFTCTCRERVQLAASMFTRLADIWWKTVRPAYAAVVDA